MNVWKRMTDAGWKIAALVVVVVAVVVIVLLLLGDTLGVNHQGHSAPPMPSSSSVSRAAG